MPKWRTSTSGGMPPPVSAAVPKITLPRRCSPPCTEDCRRRGSGSVCGTGEVTSMAACAPAPLRWNWLRSVMPRPRSTCTPHCGGGSPVSSDAYTPAKGERRGWVRTQHCASPQPTSTRTRPTQALRALTRAPPVPRAVYRLPPARPRRVADGRHRRVHRRCHHRAAVEIRAQLSHRDALPRLGPRRRGRGRRVQGRVRARAPPLVAAVNRHCNGLLCPTLRWWGGWVHCSKCTRSPALRGPALGHGLGRWRSHLVRGVVVQDGGGW